MLIYTTSTVKDTTANLQRFITRNLAAGADHMFLFLEGDDAAEQARALAGPHVTTVPTTGDYWQPRPHSLNVRQTINANLANCLLAACEWAGWLFHIDGDECLDVDRDYLTALPAREHVVHLRPLEAASHDHGTPRLFKQTLGRRMLRTLHSNGAILAPTNRAYFRGHTAGKAGVRPSIYVTPRVHVVRAPNHAQLVAHRSPDLRVLHYESPTAAEFARKWTALLSNGNVAAFRSQRRVIAEAIRDILAADLPPADRDARILEVYEQYGRDNVPLLDSLGLLVEPDEGRRSHVPTPHTLEQAEVIADLLPRLLGADRRFFNPSAPARQPVLLMEHLASRARRRKPALAKRLRWAQRH